MKWWWLVALATGVLVVGIILGLIVELGPKTASPEATIALREVLLGSPARVPSAENPWQASDRLTSKQRYTTTDPLALRVVSAEPGERQIELTVRLLKEDGSFETLTPSTISVAGGTGGYCCWYVDSPGVYKLQIFRAGSTPFVIPLTITSSRAAPKNPLSI